MRIIIVLPQQSPATGNWVTARRMQEGLARSGHQVTLQETPPDDSSALTHRIADWQPDVALLLHAYRAGKPWLEGAFGSQLPYAVLLTGTDVNFGLDDPRQRPLIAQVLQQAGSVLAQSRTMKETLSARFPELSAKIIYLPAGVSLGAKPYALRKRHRIAEEKILFLCPAGLRPVKGVRELLKLCDPVAADEPSFHVAFCGPVLDRTYAQSFLDEVRRRPWASYLGTLPPDAMPAAMRAADVVLNNSLAEGLPNTLLEAVSVGIPVLARRTAGNADVVVHEKNGFLFDTPQEFSQMAGSLVRDGSLRKSFSAGSPPIDFDASEEIRVLELLLNEIRRERLFSIPTAFIAH